MSLKSVLLPSVSEGLAVLPRHEALTISIGIASSMVAGLHFLTCGFDRRHPIWASAEKAHELFMELSNSNFEDMTTARVTETIELVAGIIFRLRAFQNSEELRQKLSDIVGPICGQPRAIFGHDLSPGG